MDKIVTDLGCNNDFIALVRKCFRNQFFAQSVSVRVSRIEQRDTEIECFVHERNRLALGKVSPPTGGNSPRTKTNFAHSQIGIFVGAEPHS